MSDTEPQIADNADAGRYELVVDGTVAGYAEYSDKGERRTVTHTVVEPAYEGRGLASQLVRFVLDDIRGRDQQLVPVCPFVRSYLERHPDDIELVPADERERFGLEG